MDDSYTVPRGGHIMGKGQIILVTKSRTLIQEGIWQIEVLAHETMKNSNYDFINTFSTGEEVVYKADRCLNPTLKHLYKRFICTYIRKIHDCKTGIAEITELQRSFGYARDPTLPNKAVFFNAIAFKDTDVKKYYSKIKDCRLFFRASDQISYVAVNRASSLYILHFDLLMNQSFEIDRSRSISQTLTGIIVDFPAENSSCLIWATNLGLITLLKPELVHISLTNLKDVLQCGDRVSFEYKDSQIMSVQLLDQKAINRLKNCIHSKESPNQQYSTARRTCIPPSISNSRCSSVAISVGGASVASGGLNRFSSSESLADSQPNYSTRNVATEAAASSAQSDHSFTTSHRSNFNGAQKVEATSRIGSSKKPISPTLYERFLKTPTTSDREKIENEFFTDKIETLKLNSATLATLSVRETECQTDPPTETSIVEEIMADEELFKFIASKNPNIIRKWYMAKCQI